MRHRCGAVSAVFGENRAYAVKFAVMFLSLKSIEHFFHEVVDKEHLEFHRRVVDRNRQVVCDIMAERADGAVVVRLYPLADKIREAVNQHLRSGFLCIGEEQILAGSLGETVFRCAESSRKRRLNRG